MYASCGLRTVWKEERNFRIEAVIGLLVFVFSILSDFNFVEMGFIIFSITIVLTAEMVNTAIEDLCNKVEPNTDPIIGKVKDVMSAFVLVSTFGTVCIGILVILNHF